MAQTVRFLTDPYVQSHQKQPRGRGAWEFTAYADGLYQSITTPSLTFGEAKRCAAIVARNAYPTATEIFVEVLP